MAMRTSGARGPYAKSAVLRRRVLDGTLALLTSPDQRNASLRAIAAHLGVAHASLLHHFGTKEGLLTAVLAHRDDRFRITQGATGTQPTLRVRLTAVLQSLVHTPELVRLNATLTAQATVPDHPSHDFFARRHQLARDNFASAIAQLRGDGHVPAALDPEAAASVLLAVIEGLQVQWLYQPDVDMPKVLDQFLDDYLGPAVDVELDAIARTDRALQADRPTL